MVKAEIKTSDGTHIIIDGKEEEVKKIIRLFSTNKNNKEIGDKNSNGKSTISDMLHELKEDGFFDEPRGLVEIKDALAEKGMVYAITTLSSQLIRQVRRRNLGRVREGKKWRYVRR